MQVVSEPRLAGSRALQQLLVPPAGHRLVYIDPGREVRVRARVRVRVRVNPNPNPNPNPSPN